MLSVAVGQNTSIFYSLWAEMKLASCGDSVVLEFVIVQLSIISLRNSFAASSGAVCFLLTRTVYGWNLCKLYSNVYVMVMCDISK